MSFIQINKTAETLAITLQTTFNLYDVHFVEEKLTPEINTLQIDLGSCKIVDSEAVIFMYRWQASGNVLKLIKPPDVLFEILDILELRENWNPVYDQPNIA